MGFVDYRYSLLEDEADDRKYRSIALRAYETVKNALREYEESGSLDNIFFKRPDGALITQAVQLKLDEPGLYIMFNQGNGDGGLGFAKDVPVIVFSILLGKWDTSHIHTRLDRDLFVHEYIHFLDWKRIGHRITGSADMAKGAISGGLEDYQNYINSPGEFNAYYQEGASVIYSMVKNPRYTLPTLDILIGGTSFENFLKTVKKKHFSKWFIDHLNPSYMRKLDKRLYRFWMETIKPILDERMAKELSLP